MHKRKLHVIMEGRRGKENAQVRTTAVVVADLPADLGLATNLKNGGRGHLGQRRAKLSVARLGSVDVVSRLGVVPVPRRAARQAAGVSIFSDCQSKRTYNARAHAHANTE